MNYTELEMKWKSDENDLWWSYDEVKRQRLTSIVIYNKKTFSNLQLMCNQSSQFTRPHKSEKTILVEELMQFKQPYALLAYLAQ